MIDTSTVAIRTAMSTVVELMKVVKYSLCICKQSGSFSVRITDSVVKLSFNGPSPKELVANTFTLMFEDPWQDDLEMSKVWLHNPVQLVALILTESHMSPDEASV